MSAGPVSHRPRTTGSTPTQTAPPPPPPSETAGGTYQIKRGDTLSGIARDLGVPMEQLLAANPQIKDPNKIYAGNTLNLPAPQAETPSTPRQDTFTRTNSGSHAPVHTQSNGHGQPAVTADPHARQQLSAELHRARTQGAHGNTHPAGTHAPGGSHGTEGSHGAEGGHGADGAHGHDSHTATNFSGNTNLARADGHSTGTHLGDTGHMPLNRTILQRSTQKPDAHGHGAAHHDNHHGPEVNANGTIAAVHVQSKWNSALGNNGQVGHDPTFLKDETGAAAEGHVLAERHSAGGAIGVDLKKGQVIAGGDASAQFDLIGGSARAQAGSSNSVRGQVYIQGEAHVGARAAVGGGVSIDPRQGTAKVGVGGEAFAGAEVRASTGYQNKYVGVEAEVRGQAGIGVAGRAEVGFERGVFKAKADLGACVGLGGRVTVNVNVNVGAMARDAYSAASSVASSAWSSVKSWF